DVTEWIQRLRAACVRSVPGVTDGSPSGSTGIAGTSHGDETPSVSGAAMNGSIPPATGSGAGARAEMPGAASLETAKLRIIGAVRALTEKPPHATNPRHPDRSARAGAGVAAAAARGRGDQAR